MNRINFKEHILPHIVAVTIFLSLTVIFFNPVFFDNKEIRQYDIMQWRGGAQELLDFRAATGEEGLWTNSMFSGMPGYLVNVHFSGEGIAIVHQLYSLWLPHPVSAIFIALISFYILLLTFRVRPYLAIGGAIAFAFTSFTLISLEAGHNAKVIAIAYMPLILAGIHLAFRQYKFLGFSLTAMAMALQLNVNHLQITYYLLLIVLIYGVVMLYHAYKEKTLKQFFGTVLVLVGAVVLALGANAGRILTTLEYSEYSIRGKSELTPEQNVAVGSGLDRDYAFQWSSGIGETMTLLIPGFYGGATQENVGMNSHLGKALANNNVPPAQVKQVTENAPTYWGDQPMTAGPVYAGAVVIFLFVLGICFAKRKYVYWLVSAVVLSLMLSWGKNFETFNYFMFDYFPGYNKFRAVTMSLNIALLCMPLLGFLGLERLLSNGFDAKVQKKLLISFGVTGGLSLLFFLFAGMFNFNGAVDAQLAGYPSWYLNALKADREAMMRGDALRSFIFIVLAAGLLWFYLKGKLGTSLLMFGIGLLILIDLWAVDKRYLTEENYVRPIRNAFFEATPADQRIMTDQDAHYRVLNLQNPWNDARTSYFHKSIGGYHGAKMRRYQDLIDRCINPEIGRLIEDFQSGSPNFESYNILNMLNAKYLLAGSEAESVFENPSAHGNAWFVENVVKVNSPDEEIAETCNVQTGRTAVIDASKFDVSQTEFAQGTITLETYQPNKLVYQANVSGEGLAVFSEIYYPEGWKATIDGQSAEIIRVNYVLRALEIPEGQHTITFTFEPQSYVVGNKMMGISFILIVLAFVGSVGLWFRKRGEEGLSS